MSEYNAPDEDEIDLLDIFQTLWEGKWKVVVISSLFVFIGQLWVFVRPNPFELTTELKPITSVEAERYSASNALGFFKVSPSLLLNLSIEELDTRDLFITGIDKFELLEKDGFETLEEYDRAVIKFASAISILPPNRMDSDGKINGAPRQYWEVSSEHTNEESWRNMLSFVIETTTESVRENLKRKFDIALEIAMRKRQFQLEDFDVQITNMLNDYDRKIIARLAFLREQTAIARKLSISKNVFEAQVVSGQSGISAIEKLNDSFYLRGYNAIEKEIELIESRTDKKAFIVGLLELEQSKRTIEQNKTIDRAKSLFDLTPIVTKKDFTSVSVMVDGQDFKYKSRASIAAIVSLLIGGMVSVFYVLLSKAIRKRRDLKGTSINTRLST